MSKFPLIATALLLVSTPVFAQIIIEDSPLLLPPTKAGVNKSDWDKVVCCSQDVLGSRLEKHQVCLTKWQWWTYEQEEKQQVYDWQRIGMVSH